MKCHDPCVFSNLHEALRVARLRKLLFARNHVRISYATSVIARHRDAFQDKRLYCVESAVSLTTFMPDEVSEII